MADANTSKYGLTKPEVGASADTWGGKLNSNFDDIDVLLGAIATGGSSNAYTLTTGLSLSALANGQGFWVKWNHTNAGAATLNVDTLGAVDLKRRDGSTALGSGDATSGAYAYVVYDSAATCFRVVVGIEQEKDATLTALAAGATGADVLFYWSGSDTLSTTTLTSAARSILDDASVAAICTTLGAAQLGAANVFTQSQSFPLAIVTGLSAAAPRFMWSVTDGAADAKHWWAFAQNGVLIFCTLNDAQNATGTWLQVTRSGATPTIAEFDNVDLRLEAAPASRATNSAGFLGFGTPAVKTADWTPSTVGDLGHMQRHNSGSSHTMTLPTFASVPVPDGCGFPVENIGAGSLVIAAPSGGTLYNDAGASGSVTLAQHHGGTVYRDETSGTNVWRYRGSHS